MSVFTVHEPPLRAAETSADPDRFAFVRDGFSVRAFLFSALWMLWHRMWLVLLIYVAVVAVLETAMRRVGVSAGLVAIIGVLASLLVGIEAGTLRRFALDSGGWEKIGIVSGHDREDAERRFFDAWLGRATDKTLEPSKGSSSPPAAPLAAPRRAQSPDVIGLFPEPGVSR